MVGQTYGLSRKGGEGRGWRACLHLGGLAPQSREERELLGVVVPLLAPIPPHGNQDAERSSQHLAEAAAWHAKVGELVGKVRGELDRREVEFSSGGSKRVDRVGGGRWAEERTVIGVTIKADRCIEQLLHLTVEACAACACEPEGQGDGGGCAWSGRDCWWVKREWDC